MNARLKKLHLKRPWVSTRACENRYEISLFYAFWRLAQARALAMLQRGMNAVLAVF